MRIVTAFIAAVPLACAPLHDSFAQRGVTAPHVTVQTLEALPISAGQQRFRVTLRVDNQNTEPLRIRSVEFKLRLADQGIVDGAAGALVLEALDQTTLELTLGSEIISSLSRLMAFVEGPDNALPYEIHGVVTLERRLRQLPFSARGLVPLATTAER